MSASLQPPAPEDTARRSKQVALVLLGTMGVIGGVVVLVVAIWQLAHGGGYKTVGLILGVLAIALVALHEALLRAAARGASASATVAS